MRARLHNLCTLHFGLPQSLLACNMEPYRTFHSSKGTEYGSKTEIRSEGKLYHWLVGDRTKEQTNCKHKYSITSNWDPKFKGLMSHNIGHLSHMNGNFYMKSRWFATKLHCHITVQSVLFCLYAWHANSYKDCFSVLKGCCSEEQDAIMLSRSKSDWKRQVQCLRPHSFSAKLNFICWKWTESRAIHSDACHH